MAEAALFGLTKTVLTVLSSLATDEFRVLWGHKADREKLEDTITTIRDVLQDADHRQATDAAVQRWLARLKLVLYEADDLFDTISAKVLHEKAMTGSKIKKEVLLFLSKPYSLVFFVKAAHKVKEIRERLDDIANDINRFKFLLNKTDHKEQAYRFGREQTHSYIRSNEVVGRETEREDIVTRLLPECFREQIGVSVIAVVGMGGLGKTTLAKLVYNDERVQQGFKLCMWACINYFSDLKRVLITLLKSIPEKERKEEEPDQMQSSFRKEIEEKRFVPKSELEDSDLDQLQSLFRNKIRKKRFLLVLDDVLDESTENWNNLKTLLNSGKPGSMVLATTRSVKVADSLLAAKPYYHLPLMSDESAWSLFKKIAFGETDGHVSRDLEQLGLKIVSKCANVPLVIVTIANLLRHKEKKKWFPLVYGELSKVEPDAYKKITHVLKMSYNELPYPVKRCFAYCSLFPKDYEFERSTLVRLWIAQGFVEPYVTSQSLEDRADEYFFCLVDRCFLQDTKASGIKGVARDTYKVHDLVLDLAKEVSEFETILVDQIAQNSWDKTLRHVSLNCKSDSLVDTVCSFSHSKSLRTFLWISKFSVESNALKKLMSSFKALRVLDLSRMDIKEIPPSIGELIHLRLIDLSHNVMEMIPSSVCSLHLLQSLILQGCRSLKELPKDLASLLSLRHLVLEGCNNLSQMPPGLAALKSLVSLDRLVVNNHNGGLSYLMCLDSLSESLNIELPTTGWKNAIADAERSCLSRKSRLHALAIQWKTGADVEDLLEPETVMTVMNALKPHPNLEQLSIFNFGGREIPAWFTSLNNLAILKVGSCGRCVELPPLSHLPSLKELYIQDMSSVAIIEDNTFHDPNLFFPSLETLWIWNMPNLTSWWSQAPTVLPAFPRLTRVNIRNCRKLTTCIPSFPLVDHLKLESVRKELLLWGVGGVETDLASCKSNALRRLRITRIRGLCNIQEAQTRHLSNLRKLSIYRCEEIESVSCIALASLTSLEKLKITACKKLRWVDVDDQKPEVPWGQLPRLKYLEIPTVNANLFKGFKYLTSLQVLKIYNLNQKLYLVKGVRHLSSLQRLTLTDFKELYLSWRVLLSLSQLRFLTFSSVEKVTDIESTKGQTHLCSLLELKIYCGLAEWIHHMPWESMTSLQYLHLSKMPNLEALPEGVRHLTSLQQLKIMVCTSVVSLPCWMRSLTSLLHLEIHQSSEELKRRCRKHSGEDWPNIQHIEDIIIT